MTIALLALAAAAIAAAVAAVIRIRARARGGSPSSTRRILFPFTGSSLSSSALDAALRLARAEEATLVPAYLAEVPLTLPLDSSLPKQCEAALPILEAIEQRAARSGVAVDPRIERGRTNRHALADLIGHEDYDRIVAPAASRGSPGFSADDVAWLLDHAEGEIVVFRSGGARPSSPVIPAEPAPA